MHTHRENIEYMTRNSIKPISYKFTKNTFMGTYFSKLHTYTVEPFSLSWQINFYNIFIP
jgi:hypothetical protein